MRRTERARAAPRRGLVAGGPIRSRFESFVGIVRITARPPARAARSAPYQHPFPRERHPRARPGHDGDLGGVAAPEGSSETHGQRARPRVRNAWEQCAQGLWSGGSTSVDFVLLATPADFENTFRKSTSGPFGRSTGARERAAHVERACTHLPLQMRTKAVRDSTTRARSGPSSRCSGLYTSAHASELSS
jgi:hypothetical protein